jgi:hypothetical protein
MANAIAKSRLMKPHVRTIGEGWYKVSGSRGNEYNVTLAKANGHCLGSCDCAAGKLERFCCVHIAAACALHIAIKRGYAKESNVTRYDSPRRGDIEAKIERIWREKYGNRYRLSDSLRKFFSVTHMSLMPINRLEQFEKMLSVPC